MRILFRSVQYGFKAFLRTHKVSDSGLERKSHRPRGLGQQNEDFEDMVLEHT